MLQIVAICFGNAGPVRISAAAFGAFGTELRSVADGSRDSSFQGVATSPHIAEIASAEYFVPRHGNVVLDILA